MAAVRLCGSLKIEKHPRGHVANCNGSLEAVGASVEQCREFGHPNNAQVSSNYKVIYHTLSRCLKKRCSASVAFSPHGRKPTVSEAEATVSTGGDV